MIMTDWQAKGNYSNDGAPRHPGNAPVRASDDSHDDTRHEGMRHAYLFVVVGQKKSGLICL